MQKGVETRSHPTTPLKVTRTLSQGSPNFFVRGPQTITQQFEGRTPQVMWLFQDMLNFDKSTNVY